MTDAAAFQGTYSDIKLIRSRKVAVVCVEIPIEAATAFVAAFGMPDPSAETWIALARMNDVPRKPKEKRPFSELPPAQQAALACKREAFQRWIFYQEPDQRPMKEVDEEIAAEFVRRTCVVNSRSELTTHPDACKKWLDLYHNFQLWLGEPDL